MLDGLRGEDSIAELCRREGINQNLYYRWSKEFLGAGKKRLADDTAREATSEEVKDLRRQSAHDYLGENQMMAFSEVQVQALAGKLSAKHVRTRQANGRTLSYIEGWHVIAEANRIFGFDAWDRQTMTIKCVWEGPWQGRYTCSYVARVRVRVRAGDIVPALTAWPAAQPRPAPSATLPLEPRPTMN